MIQAIYLSAGEKDAPQGIQVHLIQETDGSLVLRGISAHMDVRIPIPPSLVAKIRTSPTCADYISRNQPDTGDGA